jgi:hypothetical protein
LEQHQREQQEPRDGRAAGQGGLREAKPSAPGPAVRQIGLDVVAMGVVRARVAAFERGEGQAQQREDVEREELAAFELQLRQAQAQNSDSKLRLKAHARINEAQALQRQDGALVQLSCRSRGNSNLLATLKVGESVDVTCPQLCHMASWSAVLPDVEPLRGKPGFYDESSLVCFAAQHALGVHVTAFSVEIAYSDSPVGGVVNYGIRSAATEKESFGFVTKSDRDLSEVRIAKHHTHLSAEEVDSLHRAYYDLDDSFDPDENVARVLAHKLHDEL